MKICNVNDHQKAYKDCFPLQAEFKSPIYLKRILKCDVRNHGKRA